MNAVQIHLIALLALACAAPAVAQNGQDWGPWEGKVVKDVKLLGFTDPGRYKSRFVSGKPMNAELRTAFLKTLSTIPELSSFRLIPSVFEGDPNGMTLTISVQEYRLATEVRFVGLHVFEVDDIRSSMRVGRHDFLDPYQLKLDQEYLTNSYKDKGYYFAEAKPVIEDAGPNTGLLTWNIVEGPEVEVDEIIFTGADSIDTDELLDIMSTKDAGIFSSAPFVERKLLLDLERIKLYYWLEGWQDIYNGERVFVEGLDFSGDRSEVDIRIHVKEPVRYAIKSITVTGNTLFTTDKIMEWFTMQPGDPASERKTEEYLKIVRSRYGEQAYIMARISHEWVQENPEDQGTLALRIKIEEGAKLRIGRIDIENNSRTKDEVIRRELRDFAPGEYYNEDKLQRGINRLYDYQYFTYGTIKFWHEPGATDGAQDVKIQVEEGNTGSIRLLGGYSSAFGFLGVFEVTQRNFDITDTPDTLGEMLSGDSFVGAGQIFRLRIMPGQRRQSYSVEFQEPYLFGESVGMTIRGFDVITLRRSWEEETIGGNLIFDKRWDELTVEMAFTGFQIDIGSVENDAPRQIQSLAGQNLLMSLTPGIRYDTRDSATIPTEGILAEASVEFAGGVLPGDFDYYKASTGAEYHFVLYEAEERNRLSRYVLSSRVDLGYGQPYDGTDDIPIFRRFFAGGRGSVRGYDFRGLGPHEGDDSVGGKVLAVASVEYSMPMVVDFLRLAAWYDVGTLTNTVSEIGTDTGEFRHVVGFGFRVIIPFLGNTPVALDFGFPLNEVDGDDEQFVTFDIGRLF